MCRACLTYQSLKDLGPCNFNGQIQRRLLQYPLLSYAATEWAWHASQSEERFKRRELLTWLSFTEYVGRAGRIAVFLRPDYRPHIPSLPTDVVALHLTAFFGMHDVVAILLWRGGKPDNLIGDCWTGIWWLTALLGLLDVIGTWLAWSSTAGALHSSCFFALRCMGAVFVVLDMANVLSRQGVDVNALDSNGWTALRWAALHDHPTVIRLLIEAGIDVDLKDGQGNTTLMWALNERKLVREPPITRSVSPSGDMQMHIGNTYDLRTSIAYPNWILPWPTRCSDDVLGLLIFHAKDIDAANFCQRTPLIQAADNRQFQYVAACLSRGANIDRHDHHGLNALLCALQ